MLKKKKHHSLWILVVGGGVFSGMLSCGFLEEVYYSNTPSGEDRRSSQAARDQRPRLSSKNTCFENEDCKDLCHTMLYELKALQRCYRHSEEEVQGFKDTYELLENGEHRKLEKITEEEMELFLKFGPELWKSAIKGFERGRKEEDLKITKADGSKTTCKELAKSTGPDSTRYNRFCRRDNHYRQFAYNSEGAADALSWIASNDWLAKLLLKHDKDRGEKFSILRALTYQLHKGKGSDRLVCHEPDTAISDECEKECEGGTCSDTPASNLNSKEVFWHYCLHKSRYNYCQMAACEEAEEALKLGQQFEEEMNITPLNRRYCDGFDLED